MSDPEASKLAVFEGKRIRKVLHEGEWWFSIIDVVEVLVGGDRPRKYWNDMKKKIAAEGYVEVSEKNRTVENVRPGFPLMIECGVCDGNRCFSAAKQLEFKNGQRDSDL
jgi:hypothetical protein